MEMMSKETYMELAKLMAAELSMAEISQRLGISEAALEEQIEFLTRLGRRLDNYRRFLKGVKSGTERTRFKSIKISEDVRTDLTNVIKVDEATHTELSKCGSVKDSYNDVIKCILRENKRLNEMLLERDLKSY